MSTKSPSPTRSSADCWSKLRHRFSQSLKFRNCAPRLIVLAIIIGFPIALVLAWAFELTPQGIKRTERLISNAALIQPAANDMKSFFCGAKAAQRLQSWRRRRTALVLPNAQFGII